jgi:hypothetical protein
VPRPNDNHEVLQMSVQEKQDKKDKTLSVTVRATNGATWETEFKGETKVAKVIREALDHFIAEGAMADGDYRLARVVGGQAQPPLPEDAKLADTDVEDGALLTLLPRDPQVDG